MEVMVPAVPSKAPLGGAPVGPVWTEITALVKNYDCLLYTSDAADERK